MAKCDFAAGCPKQARRKVLLIGADGIPQIATNVCSDCYRELKAIIKEAKGSRLETKSLVAVLRLEADVSGTGFPHAV